MSSDIFVVERVNYYLGKFNYRKSNFKWSHSRRPVSNLVFKFFLSGYGPGVVLPEKYDGGGGGGVQKFKDIICGSCAWL